MRYDNNCFASFLFLVHHNSFIHVSVLTKIFAYCEKDPRDQENLIETKVLRCNYISNIHDIIFTVVSSLGSNDGDVNLDAILTDGIEEMDNQSNSSIMNENNAEESIECNAKKEENNIDEDIPIW